MTWALGDNQARAFVGNIKAEKIAQGAQVIWTRVAAKNPSGVANSNTEAQLSWTDDSGIELQFVIERALDAAFTVDLTTLTVGPNQQLLIDNALSHDTTYYYRVKGDYPAGQVSDFSDVVTITTLNLVAPPTPVSATGTSNSSISLAWIDNSNNEDGFKIERSTSSTGPFTEIADLPSDATSYNDVGLTYNTTYHYRIIGYNTDDTSAPAVLSATTTNDLLSPSGLTVVPISNSVIELNWQDNTVNEDGFKIARSTDGINYTDIDTVGPDVVTYTDTGLTFNTTYYYQVRGYNTSGDSNTVDGSATTTNSLSAPTNLVTTSITNTSIGLQWTDNSINEDGFTINGFDLDNSMQSIGSVNLPAGTTSYTWGSLLTDNSYSFQVIATNPSGSSSALSGSFTTTDTLSDITGFSATAASNTTISLSWTDTSDNEDGFKIARSTDGINYTDIDTLSSGTTNYTDTGLTFNTTYHYQVRSFNTSGDSNTVDGSATTTNSLTAPTITSATVVSHEQVDISFTDTNTNEDSFELEFSSDGGSTYASATNSLTSPQTSATYSHIGLTQATTYQWRIRAKNTSGVSSWSTAVSATTQAGMNAPAISLSEDSDGRGIVINITDNTLIEDSFTIERSSTVGGVSGWTAIATIPANSTSYTNRYNDDGTGQYQLLAANLNADQEYWYRVKADSAAYGDSPYSNVVSLTLPLSNFQSSTTATSIYTGDYDLGFSYTADAANTNNTFTYQLATDSAFSNIVQSQVSDIFLTTSYFTSLDYNTSYWSRLVVSGDDATSATSAQSSGAVITDTCGSTIYNIAQSGSDRTIDVSGVSASSGFYFSQNVALVAVRNYTLVSGDGTVYTLSGDATGENPNIHAFLGEALSFTNNAGGSHPLVIKDSEGNTLATETSSSLNWTPSYAGEYIYECANHPEMSASITITQKIDLNGVTRPLALDENGKPLVSIASSGVAGGGSIIIDSSHFKFTSYLPDTLSANYGIGQYWGNYDHEANSRWTAAHKSALDSGASIYDSSQIPAHWGYFANSLVTAARKTNTTGKILYIHDMKTTHTNAGTGGHYGSQRFLTAIEDISSHLGFTFEQLPTSINPDGEWLSHADSIENLYNTKDDWLNYFNQYDVIYYIGWSGRDTRLSEPHWRTAYAYLPDIFVDAITSYVNQGGGIFMSGGSPEASCQASNQILTRFGGIVSDFSVRDSENDPAYKIQTIISNTELIPQGWSSIFSGVDQNGVLPINRSLLSTITANEGFVQVHDSASTPSDAAGLYPILGKTSNFVASAGGVVSTIDHDDGTAIDTRQLIYAVTANGCSPEYAITNADILYVGENTLSFSFNSTTTSPSNTYIYELSTVSDFSTITSSYTSPLFLGTNTFTNLAIDTNYYARLRITGDIPTTASSVIASNLASTSPCSAATIDVVNDGDGTQTINISGLPATSAVTVIEDVVGTGYRGVFRPLVEDEFQNMWIGLGQSAAAEGGRLVIDSGWPKYIGYIPQEISNYGSGAWWANSAPDTGGAPQWLTSHKTFLDNGGSIYDSANIPSQFAYLYNAINYVRRSSNPTGKILYINDYYNGITNGSQYPHSYYAAQKFHSTFEDIIEWAGYTFEQCPYNIQTGNIWSHGAFLNGSHADSPSDAAGWKAFFDQYDAVVWVAANGGDGSSTYKYLSADFLNGIHDSIDDGLGFFCTTDHEPYFMQTINQVISSYGILLKGDVDRTNNASDYQVSNILSNNPNIPQGWHPLFNGLDSNSYIYAGSSEAEILYNTGQDTAYPIITKTSNYISDAAGTITITAHDDGITAIGTGELFVSTADGCRSEITYDCSVVAFNISINQSTLISTVSISNAVPGESVTIEETNSGVVTTSVFSINSSGSLVTNMHENGNNIGTGSLVITTAAGCSFTSADASTDSDFDGVPDAFDSDPNNPLVFGTDADGDGVDSSLDPDDEDASVYIVTPTSEGADTKTYPMNYAVRRSVSDYSLLLSSYGTNAAGTPSGSGTSYLSGGTYCTRYGTPGPRTIPLLAQGEKYCVNLLTDGTGENNAMGAFEWFDFAQTSCAGNSIASPVFANVVCNSGVWRTPAYSYAIVTIPFWKNDGTLFAAPFEYGGNYPLFATQSEALAFSKSNVGPISFTFDNYKFGVNESPDPFQGTGRTDSDFPANASYQANMQKQVTFWMPGGLERATGTTPPRSFATHYWVPNDGGAKHPHAPVWSQTVGDVANGTKRYPYYTTAPDQSAHAQVWPFFTDMFKFDYPADAISGSGAGDLDSDGIIDIVDSDKDNDGYLDAVDADPLNPYVFTGDVDGDGTDTLLDPDDTDSSVGLYTSSADFTLQYDYYYIRTNSGTAYQTAITDVEANGDTKDNFITGGLSYSKRRTSGAYTYFAGISLPAQTQGAKVILNTNSTNYTYLLQAGMEFINPQNIPSAGDNVYPNVDFNIDVLGFQRYAVVAGVMSSSKSYYTALHVPYLDNSGAIIANPMSHKGYYPLFRSQAEADSWGLNSASSTSVVLTVAGGHNQLGGQIFYNTDGTTRTSYNYQDANADSSHDINITETFWMPGGHTTATAITPLDAWRTHIWTPSTQAHPGFPVYAACYVSPERDAAYGIPTSERGLARWTLDGKDRATRQPDGSLLVPRIGLVDWATNTQE